MTYPINISFQKELKPHPWHPSVVYDEVSFAGHRYWMAETTFPPFSCAPYRDRWELPCIHYSDDGLRWKTVEGCPIDDLTAEQIEQHAYMSDTHLVLHNGQLECYYRLMENNDKRTVILRKTSVDGVHWSEREVVVDTDLAADVEKYGKEIVSQAIVWDEDACWMYYVNDLPANEHRGVSRCMVGEMASERKGETAKEREECVLEGCEIVPWHIDVQRHNGKWYMLVYDFEQQLSLFESNDGLHFSFIRILLTPSHRFWDFYSTSLYRACMVWVDNKMRVYFSASHGKDFSSIGLLEIDKDGVAEVVNGYSGVAKVCYWWRFAKMITCHIGRVIKRFIRK